MPNPRTRRRSLAVAVLACLVLSAGMALAATKYHGNRRSKVFHKPGCRYYNCKNCTVEFETREEAIRAGYRPCKVCRP